MDRVFLGIHPTNLISIGIMIVFWYVMFVIACQIWRNFRGA